ncbi:MAG: cobalamin biosynthesis protein CobQ [Pseudomonadota bacterium]
MNTPAHLLVGAALFARKDIRQSGKLALFGSLLPDLSLYLLAGTSLFLLQIPPQRVFDELYFSEAWQSIFAIDNSFLIWGLILAIALFWKRLAWVAFAGAGLVHIVTDFAMHNDDARPHFWPLSDWVFESPFSYWDSDHNAAMLAPFTLLAVLISAWVLWKRWPNWGVRIAVLIGCGIEIWVVRQWLLFF